ncbi:MAG: arylesterase [Alphaproteobacteria bacterium]|nr:arylesterase [Alphaproteobacteria bacterium]
MAIVLMAGLQVKSVGAAQPASDNSTQQISIVAFGDSLTAGYNIAASASFPAQLERALRQRGHSVSVANAGVSGDTTSGGLQRLDWAVPQGTHAVILELGANDALRGIDPQKARDNLDKILSRLVDRGVAVLLAGMKSPQNWGKTYVDSFEAMFPELANKHGVLLYPFFMEGVALDPKLNLDDGLHPNRQGVAKIVAGILPKVEQLIARVKQARQ